MFIYILENYITEKNNKLIIEIFRKYLPVPIDTNMDQIIKFLKNKNFIISI